MTSKNLSRKLKLNHLPENWQEFEAIGRFAKTADRGPKRVPLPKFRKSDTIIRRRLILTGPRACGDAFQTTKFERKRLRGQRIRTGAFDQHGRAGRGAVDRQ